MGRRSLFSQTLNQVLRLSDGAAKSLIITATICQGNISNCGEEIRNIELPISSEPKQESPPYKNVCKRTEFDGIIE